MEPTRVKRPRKDEIASVLKHLREQAARERNYAKADRARIFAGRVRLDFVAGVEKFAKHYDARADRFEKVAAWIASL